MGRSDRIPLFLVAAALALGLASPRDARADGDPAPPQDGSLPRIAVAPGRARLVVVLRGFASDAGVARAALYGSARGFPADGESRLRGATTAIRDGEARVVFDDLSPGTYAVSSFHDQDGDGQLKRGTFGIPKEGIAFSRDARAVLGPPDWEDARFDLPAGEMTVTCDMRY